MKQTSASQKIAQRNSSDVDQAPSAGLKGMAVTPPAYGIGVIDLALTEALASPETVTQRQADAAGSGTSAANKTGLPDNLKAGIESLSGLALDDVRVHYNSAKPAQLQALAYTRGTEIHVGPGQERHLPHEAWHVVQQAQGRVQPTMQLKGVHVNDDAGLEREADGMGEKAIQRKVVSKALVIANASSLVNANEGVVQLAKWQWDETKGQWIMLSGIPGESAPEFAGAFDGEIFDDTPEEEKDEAFMGKRIFGDSSALAKSRFNRSVKTAVFKSWKKNREAQHLIPASLAKKYKSLQGIIDNPENGMMLPAKYHPGNTKVTHRKPKLRDHPNYTKNVKRLIKNILKYTLLKDNQGTMQMIMEALRPVNKLAKYQYLDDIPYYEFKDSWNNIHGGIHGTV